MTRRTTWAAFTWSVKIAASPVLPAGKLGMLLGTAYEIKINGLTFILTKVKQSLGGKF